MYLIHGLTILGFTMAVTTTYVLPPQIQQSLNYKLLLVPTPDFIHSVAADRKNMPANGGEILRLSRYNKLQPAMVPLSKSGVTPAAQVLTRLDLDVTMKFYGTYVTVNEQTQLQNQNNILNQAAARLGVSLRQTEDQLLRDCLASTAAAVNCVSGISADNPTEITRKDINDITTLLITANAFTITDGIEGENRFGSSPVRNSFLALCNSALIPDLENINGMINNWNYPSNARAIDGEWCSVTNLRFLISSIGSVSLKDSAMGQDVFNIFCMGLQSYASVYQDEYSTQFVYLPPAYSGPLALNATVGYKMATAPKVTNDQWLLKMRATLSL